MKTDGKFTIKQTRSLNGRDKAVIRTIKALGLGKIGSSREVNMTPAMAGMVKSVEYLLEVKQNAK